MDGVGTLGQMPELEARIQSYVAEFLAAKYELLKLKKHPSLVIKSKAAGLMSTQLRLEPELEIVLEKIKAFKEGTWQSAFEITEFATRLYSHIKKVRALKRDAGVAAVKAGEPIPVDWGTWAIPIAILAVPFISLAMKRFW